MSIHFAYPVALGAILISFAALGAPGPKPAASMTEKMPGPGGGIPHASANAQELIRAQERCDRFLLGVKKMPGRGGGVPYVDPVCRNGRPL